MKIEDVIQGNNLNEVIENIRLQRDDIPDIQKLKKEWNVETHRVITDKSFLPDKHIKDKAGNIVSTKYVNRIATPFQKDIVSKAVVFGFGNDVSIEHNAGEGSQEAEVIKIIEKILSDNKINSFNRKIARNLYRASEIAEYWYYRKRGVHGKYGFDTDFEIKAVELNPWDGEKLYPHFDSYGDLVLFAREYTILVAGEPQQFLDVWTKSEYRRFKEASDTWIEDTIEKDEEEKAVALNLTETINKIPVVYASQPNAEWADVQYDIDRLELLFSRHAEINDYHASPKTFVKGKLNSMPQAGEAGGVLQGGIDTDVKILSWDSAPESIKLEIETRLSNIFKFTNTPNTSFDNLKGLNQISGVLVKMLFMDAHIKVLEKKEIWDEYYIRRFNILKSYVGDLLRPDLKRACENLIIEPIFTPYMINDEREVIENLMLANGGKPLMSHRESVLQGNLSQSPEQDWNVLKEEIEEDRSQNLFMPTDLGFDL